MSKTYNLWSRFIGLGWGGDEGGGDTWDEDNYISICKIILGYWEKKLTIEYSWFYFVLVNVTKIRYGTLPFEKIL